MNNAMTRITAQIAMTNNGKLMIARIKDREDRDRVPELVALGVLRYARFLEARDSVMLADAPPDDPREAFPLPQIGRNWSSAPDYEPDYEGAILDRQEAAGYYD